MIPTDTAIMATLTFDQCNAGFINSLKARGLSGVRINSAHVDGTALAAMVRAIRDTAPDMVILTDTKGAEVRTTEVEADVSFATGSVTVVRYAPDRKTDGECICVNAPDLHLYVKAGTIMNVDDGALKMEVVASDSDGLTVKALNDALLGSRKSVSFTGVDLPHLPSVTEKDREAILAAREAGIDMIAHSFVRSARDVEAVRELTEGTPIKVYAKIECASALRNFKEIMEVADGILFARGDLGAAIPLETIPVVQQKVMQECKKCGKPVILSTQILQSMMVSPVPTRAEVTDMFMGVMLGASWMLLCGETAQGRYPLECVDIMRRTIEATRDYQHTL